eukprot:403347447
MKVEIIKKDKKHYISDLDPQSEQSQGFFNNKLISQRLSTDYNKNDDNKVIETKKNQHKQQIPNQNKQDIQEELKKLSEQAQKQLYDRGTIFSYQKSK